MSKDFSRNGVSSLEQQVRLGTCAYVCTFNMFVFVQVADLDLTKDSKSGNYQRRQQSKLSTCVCVYVCVFVRVFQVVTFLLINETRGMITVETEGATPLTTEGVTPPIEGHMT